MGTTKNAKLTKAAKASKMKKTKKLASTKRPKQPVRIKNLIIGYALLVIISAAITATFVIKQRTTASLPNPFTDTQQASAKVKLYYPAALPAGYQTNPASTDRIQTDIVNFSISASPTKVISVTEQVAPADFNYGTFYSTFGDKTEVKTRLGTAVIGTIDGGKTRLASLVTPTKTWVLMSASTSTPLDDLRYILSHLKQSL